MIDKLLVQRKLNQISKYLDELRPIAEGSKDDFVSSPVHYEAERLIELIVGNAIDINFHFIKELGLSAPLRYKESFLEIGKGKILPLDLSKRISDSAGLRNLLVHNYDDVDLDRIFDGLKDGIKDYEDYTESILRFINK